MFNWLKKKLDPTNDVGIYKNNIDRHKKQEALYDYGIAFKASTTSIAAKEQMLTIKQQNKFTKTEIFDIEDSIIGQQMDKAATTEGTFQEMFVLKELYDNSLVLKNEVKYRSIKTQVEELKLSYLLKLDYLEINPDRPISLPDYILPPSNIILNKNEKFYYKTSVGLIKKKRRTKSITYGGLAASIKICSGLRYKTGNIETVRHSEEYLSEEDTGSISVTDQRIIFMGLNHSFTVPLSKILNINSNNGICFIHKDGKENPYMLNLNEEKFLIPIINEAINRYKTKEISTNMPYKAISTKKSSASQNHHAVPSVFVNDCGNSKTSSNNTKNTTKKKTTTKKVASTKENITKLEIEAYNIVKYILKDVIPEDRLNYRSTTSYLSVLCDNKNYKWICRLKFKKDNKYIILPNGTPNGSSIPVEGVSSLLEYNKQIITSAMRFK